MSIPVAHPTHWLASLLYLAPVIILAGGIASQRMHDRRGKQRADGDKLH